MEALFFSIRASNSETAFESYGNDASFEVISTINHNELVFKIKDRRFYSAPGISEFSSLFTEVFYKIFSSIHFYPGDTDVPDKLSFYLGSSPDSSDFLIERTVKSLVNEKNDIISALESPFWSSFVGYKSYVTTKSQNIHDTKPVDNEEDGRIKLRPAFFCFIVPVIIVFLIMLNFDNGLLIFIGFLLLGGIEIVDGINSCTTDYPGITWKFKTPRLVFGKKGPESGLEELDFAMENIFWPLILRPILNCLLFCIPRITFKTVFFVSCFIYNQIFHKEQFDKLCEERREHRKEMEKVTSQKSRLLTLILAIWLGTFGAHYIYLRKTDQLIYRLFTLFLMIIGNVVAEKVRGYEFMSVLGAIPFFAWYFIDIILILLGRFRDANDAVIRNWIK